MKRAHVYRVAADHVIREYYEVIATSPTEAKRKLEKDDTDADGVTCISTGYSQLKNIVVVDDLGYAVKE